MLDIFRTDAFKTVSLTAAINELPFAPRQVQSMGLFTENGIRSTTAVVELRDGLLTLVPSKPRGGESNFNKPEKRRLKSVPVPHIPLEDSILATDVQDLRSFGSEDNTEAVSEVVNRRMANMVEKLETTIEWLMVGALRGKVVDGDGTTELVDLFDLFDVTQQTQDFALNVSSTSVKVKATEVQEKIESALGGTPFTGIHALCGQAFWKSLISHPDVKEAFDRWENGEFLRQDPFTPFNFAGISWERYRGNIGGTHFVPTDECIIFPTGVPDMYQLNLAPGNSFDAANTLGLRRYASMEPMKHNAGMDLLVESNPLPMVHRPKALIRGSRTSF